MAAAAPDAPAAPVAPAAPAAPARSQCKSGCRGVPAAAPAAVLSGALACKHPSRSEPRRASARPVPRGPRRRGRRIHRAGRGPRDDETRGGGGGATARALRLLQQVGERRGARHGARDGARSRQGRRRARAADVAVARARCRLPGWTLRERGATGSRGVAHRAADRSRAGGAAQLAPPSCRRSGRAHGRPGPRLT